MGLDAPLAQTWRVGVMAGYSRSDFDVNDRASSGRSDNYHLGAYGGGQWGALGLRGGVAYSWHDIATRRSVAMPGFSDRLKAGYDGRSAQAYADLSYRIDLSAVALEPFVNLAYVNLRTGGYRERRRARPRCMRQARRARRSSRPWARGPRRASNWAVRRPRCGIAGMASRHGRCEAAGRASVLRGRILHGGGRGARQEQRGDRGRPGSAGHSQDPRRPGLSGSAIGVGAGPWRAREPDRSFLGAAGPRRPGGASRPYTRAVARIQPSRKSSGSSSICSSVCASRVGKSTHT